MRNLIAIAALASLSMPAFAEPVPEPSGLSLLGIGALGLVFALRKRK